MPGNASVPRLTKCRAVLGLALATSGVAATASCTHALTSDSATVGVRGAASPPVIDQPMSTGGPLNCAMYNVPTLDIAAIPVSTLTEGSPYVIDCEDADGRAVINQIVIHNPGR
jgi:hypothetical protein